MHVIRRLMMNYDTSRRYLNFNLTDFYICPHLVSRVLQTLDVPPLANELCLLRGFNRQSRMGLIFYCPARMYSTDCAVLSAIIKLLNS